MKKIYLLLLPLLFSVIMCVGCSNEIEVPSTYVVTFTNNTEYPILLHYSQIKYSSSDNFKHNISKFGSEVTSVLIPNDSLIIDDLSTETPCEWAIAKLKETNDYGKYKNEEGEIILRNPPSSLKEFYTDDKYKTFRKVEQYYINDGSYKEISENRLSTLRITFSTSSSNNVEVN